MRTRFLEEIGFRENDGDDNYWFWNRGHDAEYDLQWWPRTQSLMVATEDCTVRLLYKPSEKKMRALIEVMG